MRILTAVQISWRDLAYASRGLRTNPIFAATALVILALAIGSNTAIFTLIRSILLKPLEFREPDRLARLVLDLPLRNVRDQTFSLVRLDEMKAATRVFGELGAYGPRENFTLSGKGEPEAVKGARVSANFLDILGVAPILGRGFLPQEDSAGGPAVAIISRDLWRRRFGGTRDVVGKTAILDAVPYMIVGVLPPDFAFPFPESDVWVPRPSEWSALPSRYWRTVGLLTGFGRLKPGTTFAQANAEARVLQREYAASHPNPTDSDPSVILRVTPLRDQMVARVRPTLWTLFGAVAFVLLIACANVAGLLLARASSRSREFAIRTAIGAGRARIMAQVLVESLLVSVAGGILGVLLARWILTLLAHVNAYPLPRAGEIHLDGLALAFALLISIAGGVASGVLPARTVSRADLVGVLRASGAVPSRGLSGLLTSRGLLVAGQVALSIMLLAGAALLMKSFARLRGVDPGFQSANLLTARIALPPARYDTDIKKEAFFEDLVRRLAALPGARMAAAALSLPATPLLLQTNITRVQGHPEISDSGLQAIQLQSITPGYFQTLGIPLRRGREFGPHDTAAGAAPVAIVNETLARRLWPEYPQGLNPVGQHFSEGADKAVGWLEVVGVAGDVHERGLNVEARPEFFVPWPVHPPQTAYVAVRANGEPLLLAQAVRAEVRSLDPDQSISEIRAMDDILDQSIGARRLTLLLLAAFAGVALLLASIGIYGVIAYSVSLRTQEFGLRCALGARPECIVRLVVRELLAFTTAGVCVGLGGALVLTRLMTSLLFEVSPTDPAAFASIALLFLLVALAAGVVPVRRAARIDPVVALRMT